MADEIERLIDQFVDWIPKLFTAVIVLIIGWIIAILLKNVTKGALRRLGIDDRLRELPRESYINRITSSPSTTIALFIYWLIVVITFTIVIGVLNIPVLTDLVKGIYGYVPNILAAIVILLIALAFSASASGMILRWMGDTPTGKLASTVTPVVILSIAGFAILEQLKIAPAIVITTYIALIGSFALASAIAFGLGGRDFAARILDSVYERGLLNMRRAREDVETGRARAERDIERTKRGYRR